MKKNESIMDSPALRYKSEHYPAHYFGQVPCRIKMKKRVKPDFSFWFSKGENHEKNVAEAGKEYPCLVNSHGAVIALLPSGRSIGVKPDEFEVIEFHK